MVRSNINMTKGNILQVLIAFTMPMLISNIFQQLYNTADIMLVGNILGERSLAAIGASSAIFELILGFSFGIASGLNIVVARAYGAKDENLLKKSVAATLLIGFGVVLIIMVIAKFSLYPALQVLNTPKDIIDEAYSYISLIILFSGVMFAYNLFSGLLRAIGNSLVPLGFLIFASILNIILDIIFMKNLGMGIKGAAIATIIAQGVSAILCLIYIIRKCKILIPSKEHFKFDKELYKDMSGQGLSMAMMFSIVSIGTVILQTAINSFGSLTIAGHVAARKIQGFCCMPLPTIAAAVSTFVSQNKGANKYDRIRAGVKIANVISIIWSVIVTIFLFAFSPILIKFLSGSENATIVQNGTRYLMINSPFYIVLGVLVNLRTSLQGLGEKIIPLISSIIELIGKCIFVILLIPSLKYFGVIICEPVIWCFMLAQLVYSFYTHPIICNKEKSFVTKVVNE